MPSYNVLLYSLTDGSITFSATAGSVRQRAPQNITGPIVQGRIEQTQFGALVDLDGTGDADLTPPLVEPTLTFAASSPYAQTQYKYLVDLLGKFVTSTWRVGFTDSYVTYTAPARLLGVVANEQARAESGRTSYIIATASIQLLDFLS